MNEWMNEWMNIIWYIERERSWSFVYVVHRIKGWVGGGKVLKLVGNLVNIYFLTCPQ